MSEASTAPAPTPEETARGIVRTVRRCLEDWHATPEAGASSVASLEGEIAAAIREAREAPKGHIIDDQGRVVPAHDFWVRHCRTLDWGEGGKERDEFAHAGRSKQPLAAPLTADGVPIHGGMRIWDRNLEEGIIKSIWSAAFFGDGGQPRVMVGVIPSMRWGNVFATRDAAIAAKKELGA